jgi:MFS family permease
MADEGARRSPDRHAHGDGVAAPVRPRERWIRAAFGWLPAELPVRRLLLVSFIDSIGTGMFLSGSALFFTRDLGLTAGQVGLGLSLAGAAGFLCSVPIGRVSDKVGPLPTLVALQLWRAACFFAYPFVDSFGWFIAVSCLAGVGEWAAGPVVQSLLGSFVPQTSRVRTMSAMTLIRNVGFTFGAVSATGAIAVGGADVYRALVLADAVSFLFSGALLVGLRAAAAAADAESPAQAPEPRVRPGARYLALSALNGLLYLHTILLSVGLPLWVATHTRGPAALVGAIVVVNTVLAIALQMRMSRGVDGVRSAASRQFRAGCALAACCLLVAVTGPTSPAVTVALVVAATAALTVGEIYQSVGAWGVSYGLSPEASRGYYLSVYSLGSTGAMIVGPWLVTSAVLPAGAAGWMVLATFLAISGALVPMVVRGGRIRSLGASRQP